ncbi:MAG: hypothetical protein AMS23_08185 [Bacteroides sp. SM1_62]|nr:MAG: hypothetical protein AMS23_08185 [Bacteroides sp. SM1_62]
MMERISFQASVSKGWLHDKGGFQFENKYYRDPLYRRLQDREMNGFVRSKFPDYPLYHMEDNLMQAGYTNENQVLVGGIQPNLILAIALGSEFVIYPDRDSDISGNPLKDITSGRDLPGWETILDHPFIQELDARIVQLKSGHPELEIIPPFFWDSSGRATIHGIITTSFKLIGDNAMIMIVMDPDLLHVIHQWITDVYILLINHYAELAGMPITSVHVGECSGTMISNDQYCEFITPYVTQLGKAFGSIRLHSCGISDHILDAISQIENLAVIDTGSNTSVAKIREMKGVGFEINLEPPVNLMLKGSPKSDIIKWLDRVLEENQGGPIKFAFHLESGYAVENCLAIYDELAAKKLIRKS